MSSDKSTAPDQGLSSGRSGTLPFPVVGIGASAGGIQALTRFFENMPADSGMAFVVVVHLSAKHESHVDQILQRATRMRTSQVNSTVAIEKDHIYVIPPAVNLQMMDGQLNVVTAERPRERPVVVDVFFRTLAEAHKSRAVAVVLSGTGADGALGMARIKELGGVSLAQLPEDAEFDGMPRSAIENNVVDFVLPVADMPQKLLDLWNNASRIEIPDAQEIAPLAQPPSNRQKAEAAEAALSEILQLLALRTGHNFEHYKRATVLRRIERRMQVAGVSSMPHYLVYLQNNTAETPALLADMLIGVTNFFRDREAFEALERDVVPAVFEWAGKNDLDSIRIWAPACSTGQEAYSLAMVLASEAERQKSRAKVQIFATDVDESAIAVARKAAYPEYIVTDVPPNYLRQFLRREGPHYKIIKQIRDQVLFAPHNILRDPPFSRLQMVVCRNLLIYLNRRAQQHVLQVFHSVLERGGYLFLGNSETVDAAEDLFTTVDIKNRIFRSVGAAGAIRPMPVDISQSLVPVAMSPVSIRARTDSERAVSYSALHQRALEKFGPATVLIDPSFRIVHLSDKAGRFLHHKGGEPSHNLLSLVQPEWRVEVRSAVLEALKTGNPTETNVLSVRRGSAHPAVRAVVSPFKDREWGEQLLLLVFEDIDIPTPMAAGAPTVATGDAMVQRLESEIETLRSQLRQTIEHADTSTEELKASNEEFQAINEELRSATEELETSKEELESINEELITVNYELKTKVEETVKINDDLQNLISSSDIATIFVDKSMRVKWFTPKTTSLFNLIPEDRGRALTDITHRIDYPAMIADANEAFSSLRLIEREVSSKDNRWFLARLMPYRTAEHRIEGAVLNFVDITERRVAEERLREGLERLRLVAESSKDFAIVTMDQRGRVTGWNRAAELMFGYKAAEVEGKTLAFIFTPEDRAENMHERELQTAYERGHARDERWHLRKDGSRFYCSGVVYPLVDNGLRGYAKIARDLTDKHIEDYEQVSRLERTQASNVLKDEFIAIMSHELRHPLNLIQLNMDLLSRLPGVFASPKATKAIEAVRRAVRNQSQIIADLLDLSRVQTGKLKLECSSVRLAPIVSTVVDAVRAQAREGDVRLEAPGLDSQEVANLSVNGDITRIEQIAWNLVSNAVKFTLPGGVVTVTLKQEKDQARLDVQDTGIGIAPESLGKLFTMFSQVSLKHDGRRRQGLGIGLALVAQLAEAHGGRVAAASAGEGQGSTFTVWLPIVEKDEEVTPDLSVRPLGMLHGLRILLVDDSQEILDMLSTLCEIEGAHVRTAASGPVALQLLTEQDFDVLVSDIGMPA
jgi:two-component system CheB/CheR fusion protein